MRRLVTTLTPSALAARVGRMEQLASIRRLVADDGQGRGMRVIEVNNGSGLAFTLYPDRGMDLGQAFFKGTPLAWVTGNLEVAPAFYNGAGNEWLRTWGGGLLTGCGLANVGGPCAPGGEPHGLHGRLSHQPAEEVNTSSGWQPIAAATSTAVWWVFASPASPVQALALPVLAITARTCAPGRARIA